MEKHSIYVLVSDFEKSCQFFISRPRLSYQLTGEHLKIKLQTIKKKNLLFAITIKKFFFPFVHSLRFSLKAEQVKVEKKNKMAKYVCLSCFKEISELENIFSCSKEHHFCAPCGKSMHLQCEVCPKIAIKIPSHRNSITWFFSCCLQRDKVKLECQAFHFTPKALCDVQTTNLKFSSNLLFSAMNHCICWRWKMSKKIRMASSVWAIYWIYGSAIGPAAKRNSMNTSFGLTIILKYFLNFKFQRFHFKVISYCRQWHSFEHLIAILFFIITQIRRWKWFIS